MRLIGDPTAADLAITAAYAGTATSAFAAARHSLWGSQPRVVWSAVAALVAALLVNQQLDLHGPFIRRGSAVLEGLGVTMDSAGVLIATTLALLTCAVLAVTGLTRLLRTGHAPGPLAGPGLGLLGMFALFRAAAFAHLVRGAWFEVRLPPYVKAVEVLGLALIAAGALRWLRTSPAAVGESRNLERSDQYRGNHDR